MIDKPFCSGEHSASVVLDFNRSPRLVVVFFLERMDTFFVILVRFLLTSRLRRVQVLLGRCQIGDFELQASERVLEASQASNVGSQNVIPFADSCHEILLRAGHGILKIGHALPKVTQQANMFLSR
jgi:hypothetical protein